MDESEKDCNEFGSAVEFTLKSHPMCMSYLSLTTGKKCRHKLMTDATGFYSTDL